MEVHTNVTASRSALSIDIVARPAHLIEAVLPLHNHAQVLVVEDEHLDVHFLNGCCGQFLTVHQKGAIPINVHNNLHDNYSSRT